MNKKKSLLLCLCLILMCVFALSACSPDGNKSTTGKEQNNSTSDELATTISEVTEPETSSAVTTENTEETLKAEATTVNNQPSATESGNSDSDNSQTSNGKPADRNEAAKTATINVGDKDYTVNVGDRIVYTCYLKTPKEIENIQASLTYDDSILWLRQSTAKEMFPNLSGTIYNANVTGTVLFNASEPMEGYDFTDKGVLVTLNFDVAKEGYTSIATAIEFMDEIGGNAYVFNYKFLGDITCEETIS